MLQIYCSFFFLFVYRNILDYIKFLITTASTNYKSLSLWKWKIKEWNILTKITNKLNNLSFTPLTVNSWLCVFTAVTITMVLFTKRNHYCYSWSVSHLKIFIVTAIVELYCYQTISMVASLIDPAPLQKLVFGPDLSNQVTLRILLHKA